ncbi:MAG TPA: glycosyltransferase family 2 protein [Gaiellaceae bacterium]|nr:glycosyltransferase family 2 protein [Gaiellaceae bacterium]
MGQVDVVVVSFNSRRHLRACVDPLSQATGINVVVVDNASSDGSLDSIGDLDVVRIPFPENRGFAHGCNAGWRSGRAPFVLFLNPDAVIDQASVRTLVGLLDRDAKAGAVGPRIVNRDGLLEFSQRRFPRVCSTYARALFLHRLFPRVPWVDEVIRDENAYDRAGSPDWISGACILVRRSLLERLEGLDEDFFLYGEDKDLCRRLRDTGYEVRYEPRAVCVHEGGGSAPRAALLPVLAASRLRYAEKHLTRPLIVLERLGVGLEALTHTLIARTGSVRAGHARSLPVVLGPARGTVARRTVGGRPTAG